MENHAREEVIGNPAAPYLTALAARGRDFTNSHAVTHPSQPNYLALYSGSTQGSTDDSCPHTFGGGNLGEQLISAGYSFAGYSEGMPTSGYIGCAAGGYARTHNPWVDFAAVPAASNRTFAQFPHDYATLPTVAIVVPDLCHDMHDCPVGIGDAWLAGNIDRYARWATTHDSLLVLTFDEDDGSTDNQIPTLLVGPMLTPGSDPQHIDYYTLLRTLEDLYQLPALGQAAARTPISDAWSHAATASPGPATPAPSETQPAPAVPSRTQPTAPSPTASTRTGEVAALLAAIAVLVISALATRTVPPFLAAAVTARSVRVGG